MLGCRVLLDTRLLVRPRSSGRERHGNSLKHRQMLLSKTQIDRLGDRLKKAIHTESDLRLLDEYRRSFGEAYEAVVRTIRQGGEHPTGRLAKSTLSIAEKLRRESIRLSQMQDIAGCRVVVANVVRQNQYLATLKTDFPGASVVDRRDNPSHGYRAVHIIVETLGKPVEIQVRTALQHLWAELSEKSSDVLDPAIKYGGGTQNWRRLLTQSSELVASHEKLESRFSKSVAISEELVAVIGEVKAVRLQQCLTDHEAQELRRKLEESARLMVRIEHEDQEIRKDLADSWNEIAGSLRKTISSLDDLKRREP
jgi:putative GTP pyrophosphokinase